MCEMINSDTKALSELFEQEVKIIREKGKRLKRSYDIVYNEHACPICQYPIIKDVCSKEGCEYKLSDNVL